MTAKACKSAESIPPSGRDVGGSDAKTADSGRLSKAELEHRWKAEHADAIRAENDYIENMGCRSPNTGCSDVPIPRLSFEAR